MLKISKLLKSEEGAGLVLCIFVLVVALGIGGLVVDMGIIYKTKGEMRKATNAAALSGAQRIFKGETFVEKEVKYILEAHKEVYSKPSIAGNKVTVTLKKNVPLYFMKIFDINSVIVEVASSAKVGPLGAAGNAVPLGVPKDVIKDIGDGDEYVLKVGPGESEYGNFGIISLSSTWNIGKDYESDLSYGYDGEIKIGQILDTQTGNVEGKTKNAIAYRLSHSLNTEVGLPSGEIDIKNDPRVLKVLVYEEMPHPGNQLKQVKVVGYAYFYLKGPYNETDSSITGYFIKGLETGSIDEGAVEKGAYAIKLVE